MATDDPVASRREIHLFAAGEPRPGLFRYFPPATRAELWGGSALLALALLGAAWVIKCRFEALALEQDSVTVEGKVLRLWMTKQKNGFRYHVEYQYPAPPPTETQLFRNETELSREHFDVLKEGGPITAKVCRTDPANHEVVGEPPRVFSSVAAMLFCLGLLSLLALAGAINLWWWWVSHRNPAPASAVVVVTESNVIWVVPRS